MRATVAAFDQLALVHLQLAAGMVGGLGIMGHHNDGLVVLAIQLLQQAENFIGRGAVQITGGLIAQQDRGIGDDGAGDADALLLAARHFARLVAGKCDPRGSTICKATSTRRRRSALDRLVSSSGSSTLPAADSIGIRL